MRDFQLLSRAGAVRSELTSQHIIYLQSLSCCSQAVEECFVLQTIAMEVPKNRGRPTDPGSRECLGVARAGCSLLGPA